MGGFLLFVFNLVEDCLYFARGLAVNCRIYWRLRDFFL